MRSLDTRAQPLICTGLRGRVGPRLKAALPEGPAGTAGGSRPDSRDILKSCRPITTVNLTGFYRRGRASRHHCSLFQPIKNLIVIARLKPVECSHSYIFPREYKINW